MAETNSLLRNPIVLIGAAVVVIGAAAAGGYFLGAGHGGSGSTASSGGTQTAAAQGVCGVALNRVLAYGVTYPNAKLVTNEATDTGVKGRVSCKAKDGATTYTITVNQRCDDMTDYKCVQLWNVTDASGKSLFQHRDFLPPEG